MKKVNSKTFDIVPFLPYIKDMKRAKPLSKDQFDFLVLEFQERQDYRMASIVFFLARGLRIGDVLNLTVDQVFSPDGEVRQEVELKEQKSTHFRSIPVHGDLGYGVGGQEMRSCLSKLYAEALTTSNRNGYLFTGKKSGRRLTPQGVHFLLNKFRGQAKLETISSHSARKFVGRYLHAECKVDIETISEAIYQHTDIKNTRTYINVLPQEMRKAQSLVMF